MAAGNSTGRHGWPRAVILSVLASVSGSAFAGPLQIGPKSQTAEAPESIRGGGRHAMSLQVSLSAMAGREQPTENARSRAARIPWVSADSDAARIPIADPDWRMMPRVRQNADGRAFVQRSRTNPALAALRGDSPVAPGSVFSTSYGDEDRPSFGAVKYTDDRGNPVFAAPTKYFQDFEDGTVSREWDLAGLDEMEKFGRFAGPFRNSTQTLYVQCEPDTPYVVSFDLLFIAANLGDVSVSDLFSVEVDDQALLQDTFAVLRERNEKYNAEREDFDRDIYKQIAVTFTPRGDGVVKIRFKSAPHGNPGGETWGLDNVHIDVAPKQTLGELAHDDASIVRAAGVLGQMGLASSGGPFDNAVNYFRGDPSIRPPGPRGPTVPSPTPVPTPGAGALLLAGGWLATRRRR